MENENEVPPAAPTRIRSRTRCADRDVAHQGVEDEGRSGESEGGASEIRRWLIDTSVSVVLRLFGDVHVGPKDVICKLLRCEFTSLLVYANPRMMIWSYELVGVAHRLQFSGLFDRSIEAWQTWKSLEYIDKERGVLKGIRVERSEAAYGVARRQSG